MNDEKKRQKNKYVKRTELFFTVLIGSVAALFFGIAYSDMQWYETVGLETEKGYRSWPSLAASLMTFVFCMLPVVFHWKDYQKPVTWKNLFGKLSNEES